MRELWADFGWSGFLLSCYYFQCFGLFLLLEKTKNTTWTYKLLYYFTGDVFKCVCLCDVSCVFQQPQTEVYGPHKDSVQPHKYRHSNQSATEKSLTDHTHTHLRSGLMLRVALLQWDLVLSEVESSICLCPGWNELGVCRVLQMVVERRVWLTVFDSALNGHGWAVFTAEQHWPPRPWREAIFHLESERNTPELKITQQGPQCPYSTRAQSTK